MQSAQGVHEIKHVKHKTQFQACHEHILNGNATDDNKNDDIVVGADD